MPFGRLSNGFSFYGFYGLIVIIIYFIFMVYYIKKKKHNFIFSITILLIYIILLVWLSLLFNTNLTSANVGWIQTLLFPIYVEGIIYLIKSNKK